MKKQNSAAPKENRIPFPVKSSETTFLMRIKDEFINREVKTREVIKEIRDHLKEQELYHTPITTEKKLFGIFEAEGEESKKIFINTIGKYLFGVPGFPPRVKFIWGEVKFEGFFKVPNDLPAEAIELLSLVADKEAE